MSPLFLRYFMMVNLFSALVNVRILLSSSSSRRMERHTLRFKYVTIDSVHYDMLSNDLRYIEVNNKSKNKITRYHFPIDIGIDARAKTKFTQTVCDGSAVSILYDFNHCVRQLNNFTFTWPQPGSLYDTNKKIYQENQRQQPCTPSTLTHQVRITILSREKGLLYSDLLLITSYDALHRYISEQTSGTGIMTIPVDGSKPSQAPREVFVIIMQSYISFSLPPVI